ncbi:complex I intermediate-associated protein 30, mitochondrial [Platysternon megacephalum]|uniref:Complex I intermediate-associated protein 30, mitochondrial n=1 Tax=Platysternon megacephalum TaxID=55544 RepID=A0A4D9F4X2_9SAUR|nr:complex I intermediate-associated protein 30, mitochondrial [Platysternon megacephalum]
MTHAQASTSFSAMGRIHMLQCSEGLKSNNLPYPFPLWLEESTLAGPPAEAQWLAQLQREIQILSAEGENIEDNGLEPAIVDLI